MRTTFEVTIDRKLVFVGASWLDCVNWVDRRPGYVIRPQRRQILITRPADPSGIPKPEEPTVGYPDEVLAAACRDYQLRTGEEVTPRQVEEAKNGLRPSNAAFALRELIAMHAECWRRSQQVVYLGELALPCKSE